MLWVCAIPNILAILPLDALEPCHRRFLASLILGNLQNKLELIIPSLEKRKD
jgi:hypothetical protein